MTHLSQLASLTFLGGVEDILFWSGGYNLMSSDSEIMQVIGVGGDGDVSVIDIPVNIIGAEPSKCCILLRQ